MKNKTKILAVAGMTALLLVYCVVGGMDLGTISVKTGAALGFGLLAAGAWLLWKAGVIQ